MCHPGAVAPLQPRPWQPLPASTADPGPLHFQETGVTAHLPWHPLGPGSLSTAGGSPGPAVLPDNARKLCWAGRSVHIAVGPGACWSLTSGWDRHRIPSHNGPPGQGHAGHPAPRPACPGMAPIQNPPCHTLVPPAPQQPPQPNLVLRLHRCCCFPTWVGTGLRIAGSPRAAGTSRCCHSDTTTGPGRQRGRGGRDPPCGPAPPRPPRRPSPSPAAGLPSCPPTRFLRTGRALGTSVAFLPLPSPPLGSRQGRCFAGSPPGWTALCRPRRLARCWGDTSGASAAGRRLAAPEMRADAGDRSLQRDGGQP